MPQPCTVCQSPNRNSIDADIIAGHPMRYIEGAYDVSKSAIQRHRASGHVHKGIPRAVAANDGLDAHGLIASIDCMNGPHESDADQRAHDLNSILTQTPTEDEFGALLLAVATSFARFPEFAFDAADILHENGYTRLATLLAGMVGHSWLAGFTADKPSRREYVPKAWFMTRN